MVVVVVVVVVVIVVVAVVVVCVWGGGGVLSSKRILFFWLWSDQQIRSSALAALSATFSTKLQLNEISSLLLQESPSSSSHAPPAAPSSCLSSSSSLSTTTSTAMNVQNFVPLTSQLIQMITSNHTPTSLAAEICQVFSSIARNYHKEFKYVFGSTSAGAVAVNVVFFFLSDSSDCYWQQIRSVIFRHMVDEGDDGLRLSALKVIDDFTKSSLDNDTEINGNHHFSIDSTLPPLLLLQIS